MFDITNHADSGDELLKRGYRSFRRERGVLSLPPGADRMSRYPCHILPRHLLAGYGGQLPSQSVSLQYPHSRKRNNKKFDVCGFPGTETGDESDFLLIAIRSR